MREGEGRRESETIQEDAVGRAAIIIIIIIIIQCKGNQNILLKCLLVLLVKIALKQGKAFAIGKN